jgi:hypothetical protein
MGYRWHVGNGSKAKFCEDLWIGSSSLAIQYWELYCIVNEHNKTIADLWNGTNLKCTFRRCVDRRLFLLWEELVGIVSTVVLTDEEDAPAWQFHSSGIYSSQFLHAVVNFRGVKPIYLPALWKLVVSPPMHFFLWLLSKNKLFTRDNLEKRQKLDDPTCLFCSEKDSVHHLFFNCVVGRRA